MSKVSRQKLKSVVKECLVEILKEGITTQGNVSENSRLTESNSMQVSRMQASQAQTNSRNAQPPRRSSVADNISYGPRGNSALTKNPEFDQKISNTINHLTDDPIMAAIFSDSARTTLQEQLGAENKTPAFSQGDQAARTMAANDPANMFSESADKWAALAFPGATKNN